MELSFDREADAVYIKLSDSEVETNQKVNERTVLDLDSEGEVIGIELLDASNRFSNVAELNVDFSQLEKASV